MRAAIAIITLALFAGAAAPAPAAGKDGRTWYVSASADPGGDGARGAPLDSLRRVERVSRRQDTIVILPSPRRTPPLDGGLALKPRQRLVGAGKPVRRQRPRRRSPRITNTDPSRHDGDGVVLARGTTVRNLEIEGTVRGGIYGVNVANVKIARNDVSDHNVSCTEGFHIPEFVVPTTVPGAGIPITEGLANGWAGIMVDAARGKRRLRVVGNRVHHADCGDGIDVRASGRARVRAEIDRNVVTDLRQGEAFESVLAIGLQTRDRSRLVATLDRNRQVNLGNEEDPGVLVLGADSEGVFANLDGPSRMRVTVTRNRYENPRELGGFSANGVEMVNMGDGARARMTIRDSSFTATPGDILELLNFGAGGRLTMTLKRVTASRSVGFGNTVVIPGNNGDCLLVGNGAAGGDLSATVRDSELTNCANNGITIGSNVVQGGDGPAAAMRLDVDRSEVSGNRGSNLLAGAFNELGHLDVKIEDSDLSDSRGAPGIGVANVAFEDLGNTASSRIDLGGGALGSRGGNCLEGGPLAANVLGYDVSAESNWWGAEGGPGPGRTVTAGGSLDTDPSLSAPAPSC
ncbi:MAG: hypothetical protein ACRDK9_02000 [Solirubrobacterales bacterium]